MSRKNIFGLSSLALTLLISGCGGSDSTTIPLQVPPPIPPGGPHYSSNCYPVNIYRNTRFNQQTWFRGGQSISTGVGICANALITIRGNSEDELFVSNGYGEIQHMSREEISQGVTLQMRSPGILVWGCSHCRKLKVRFDEMRVSY